MMFSNFVTLWASVLLILSASLWCCTTAQSDMAVDCCLSTSTRRIPQKVVTSFTIQTGDGACRIPATVFVTKKGLKLCAPFPSESSWVSDLIETIIKGPVEKSRKLNGKKHRKQ
ncbi:C-C motif chemokine 19b [Misgurnus anguillicaudatus]|uniref:C-C motif chemokine 19b n=1 Tax=Misgurnus anguillicaudatus TaxID=75329 RepID=UPI002435F6A1|nr:C-C motif chemokine 19b [Misgurnus anguillicaudatus]